jgi:chemotaxis methyl-accepting protein methylase/mannose-6-phosphate isomerase-like protein (cupin superfamily)
MDAGVNPSPRHYVYSLPEVPAFKGRGLLGYTFGPLRQKNLDVYYVEVEGGHDTFMISKRISRTYYILSGSGYFTIDGRRYDVTPGTLVEVPPKVEFSYSGRMRLIAFSTPGWTVENDRHTRWNMDAVGAGFSAPLPNGSWRSRILRSRILGKSPFTAFLATNQHAWKILPAAFKTLGPIQRYGEFLHRLARAHGKKGQAFSTFFLRNRPALELVRRIAARKGRNATVRVAVLGCSTGAEVYSIAWAIRNGRTDLKLALQALDLSKEAVEVGAAGRYSQAIAEVTDTNVFERMTSAEMEGIFDRDGDQFAVKPWLREGITWRVGDASSAELMEVLGGPQDIVIASNFLCHMDDAAAEACLRNIGGLAAPGGFVIATGVDLDVRSAVASALGWMPVQELLEEIHEGDPIMTGLWPCHYAALEPFNKRRPDWRQRYAAAFMLGPFGRDTGPADAAEQARPAEVDPGGSTTQHAAPGHRRPSSAA